MKVYGPYISASNGRRFVLLIHADGSRKMQWYSRYLWEQHRGPIPDGMEVDHIDEDYLNDSIENYQLLTKADNIKKSANSRGVSEEQYHGVCPECGNDFVKPARTVRSNRKKGNAGPYCSRQCSGRANQRRI